MVMNRRFFILAALLATLVPAYPALAQKVRIINPNTATVKQLADAGLDASLVDAIQKQRPFASIVEFDDLVTQSLSYDDAEQLYVHVFVPVNLNTGTEEEIELIPGMTDHMVHEFLEYRPYPDMETFDREIGKYVDENEVARFRSYVAL